MCTVSWQSKMVMQPWLPFHEITFYHNQMSSTAHHVLCYHWRCSKSLSILRAFTISSCHVWSQSSTLSLLGLTQMISNHGKIDMFLLIPVLPFNDVQHRYGREFNIINQLHCHTAHNTHHFVPVQCYRSLFNVYLILEITHLYLSTIHGLFDSYWYYVTL